MLKGIDDVILIKVKNIFMKKNKISKNIKIIRISITILLLISIIFFSFKINPSKDLVWNINNIFHPKIVFQLKKAYVRYLHDFKFKISIEKNRDETLQSSKGRKFNFISFKNFHFKKNGPKVFLETYKDNLFTITGTGVISFIKFEDFYKKKNLNLKIVRSNLKNFVSFKKIVENPAFILNMKIYDNEIYISYVNEQENDCFNTKLLRGKINFKKIIFEEIYAPKKCVKKQNDYGEFYLLEAGGAIEFIEKNQLILSTGAFRFRDLSQNKKSMFGKILIINLKNKSQKIISIGHRNIQGMFYDKNKKILFFTDHGPQGGDEINIDFFPLDDQISNYGWPIASYGEHYGGITKKNKKKYEKAPLLKPHKKYGFEEPLKYFVPSIAPSDILFVPKKFDKQFKNNIYISSLGFTNENNRRSIHSFFYSYENKSLTNQEVILFQDRIRDIEFIDHLNSIFLSLEYSGSIGILKKL